VLVGVGQSSKPSAPAAFFSRSSHSRRGSHQRIQPFSFWRVGRILEVSQVWKLFCGSIVFWPRQDFSSLSLWISIILPFYIEFFRICRTINH
jgi:hypothetical protein